MKSLLRKQSGFTLLELLVVISIIAILTGVVIIAVRPSKQLGDARNSQRQSDIGTIVNGTYQYIVDNSGVTPTTITTTPTEICATGASTCTGLIDLSVLTANEKYLVSLPKDPLCSSVCAANGTGYKISKTANGRITVTATNAELSKSITVTK